MKRIAWLTLIAAMMLVGTASAAYISFSAPQTVYVGDTLEITGTTIVEGLPKPSLEPGFSTEIILYRAQYMKHEMARKTIVIQGDGSFSTMFETVGLEPGQYSIEIIDPTRTTFGSSSKIRQIVALVDRSGSLTISSLDNQKFDGSLDVSGTIRDLGDAGVQIEVTHDGATVYGPEYVATSKDGAFSTEVAISVAGVYRVIFEDSKGYIGTKEFMVVGTPAPTTTQAMISASASAERSAPAYFEVDTRSGIVTIATSAGIDWVIEYVDEDGELHKVNNKGMLEPEIAELVARGGSVYVKVYPMSYNDRGTVQVSASNADSVRVSQTAPGLFGDATPTPAQAAPLPAALVLLALLAVILVRRG